MWKVGASDGQRVELILSSMVCTMASLRIRNRNYSHSRPVVSGRSELRTLQERTTNILSFIQRLSSSRRLQ